MEFVDFAILLVDCVYFEDSVDFAFYVERHTAVFYFVLDTGASLVGDNGSLTASRSDCNKR